jgi:hypothetical protein
VITQSSGRGHISAFPASSCKVRECGNESLEGGPINHGYPYLHAGSAEQEFCVTPSLTGHDPFYPMRFEETYYVLPNSRIVDDKTIPYRF